MNDRPRIHFLSRATRWSEPKISARVNLLPRSTFEGTPVIEHYDKFTTLRESIAQNQRAESKERAAVEEAKATYARKIRDALSIGGDTSKIKPTAEKHEAAAAAHRELARLANVELAHASRALAHALAEHAPDLLEPSETRLRAAADDMEHALDGLTRSWGAYELAWQERRILGAVGLLGGQVGNYDEQATFPLAVREALDVLRDHLGDLEKLKSDEKMLRSERPAGVQV